MVTPPVGRELADKLETKMVWSVNLNASTPTETSMPSGPEIEYPLLSRDIKYFA